METCAINSFLTPAQREKQLSAVPLRRSVRLFSGEPSVSQWSALQYIAARSRLPGVRIELDAAPGGEIYRKLPFVDMIQGSGRYAAVIVDESVPHAACHAGISGEAFVLEAVSLGLGTCWIAAFRRGGVKIALEEGEKVKAVIALGVPGDREGPRKRKKLTEICQGDPSGWPLWAYNAAECVRSAPSAMNLQPWRLSYAGRTLMLSSARARADLDMGIALLHLSLGMGDKPHIIRWGEGKETASLIAEDRI